MSLTIFPITDPQFQPYGQVLQGYDTDQLIERLNMLTPKPSKGTIYVAGDPDMEKMPVCIEIRDRFFGGMPIQVGYCNGSNHRLDCLEYHRDSEVDIAADDIVLLLAHQQEIADGKLDTSLIKAFLVPAGTAVELYATTLHYAPCNAPGKKSFRTAIVLPRGTNTEKPVFEPKCFEDGLLAARNKWLLAHPDSSQAKNGAYMGLTGNNLDLSKEFPET
ncbi:DUF4867 family protein [Marasmitruncus massiliensis]|uniref:DUF4867 family protein n=1 Tax=Marasmitruncus massiliensis TaxID=1944642 RepID=UPI000C7C8ED9|nr:DUF4867 family protein [Marasmitruncus massiliensis]